MAMTIKEMREAAGMTQAEFAELLGANKSTIEKWEYGTRKPTYNLYMLIEYYLKGEGYIKTEENSDENT